MSWAEKRFCDKKNFVFLLSRGIVQDSIPVPSPDL